MLMRSNGIDLSPISKIFLFPSDSAETLFCTKKLAKLRNNIPANAIVNKVFLDFKQIDILVASL